MEQIFVVSELGNSSAALCSFCPKLTLPCFPFGIALPSDALLVCAAPRRCHRSGLLWALDLGPSSSHAASNSRHILRSPRTLVTIRMVPLPKMAYLIDCPKGTSKGNALEGIPQENSQEEPPTQLPVLRTHAASHLLGESFVSI